MATNTPNLNLVKPQTSDKILDTIPALANNMDILDSHIHNNDNQIGILSVSIYVEAYSRQAGETDDTGRIQRAINAAKQACLNGGFYGIKVKFAAKVYTTSSSITVPIYVNLEGEGYNATIINALFNGDAFVGDKDANNSSQVSYQYIRDLAILKSNSNGTNNTTGNILNFYHNTDHCFFSNLRLVGGDRAILLENVGYSLYNKFNHVICTYQAIEGINVGQGANNTSFNQCVITNTPICVNLLGTSVGVSFTDCDFELFTTAAVQVATGTGISVKGGYIETTTLNAVIVNLTGAGQVSVSSLYAQGNGAYCVATVADANGYVTFSDCQLNNFATAYPINGANKQNSMFRNNIPGGSTNGIVKGYIDLTSNLGSNGYQMLTHNLGLPDSKLKISLYATPNAGYMNGKEVEVSHNSGTATMGYSVWHYDNNNIQIRTCSSGGLIFDTAAGAGYTNTGVSTAHPQRIRLTLAA